MFVTNHVLSGALVGAALSDAPVTAFVVGVASHLVLDAIPHWGCGPDEPADSGRFLRVARRDGLLGLAAMAVIAAGARRGSRTGVVSGMIGAVLLDLDKPSAHFFGRTPFPAAVNRFHGAIQNESPDGLAAEFAWGAAFALGDVAVFRRRRRDHPAPAH